MNVLVTGVTGFLGGRIAMRLAEAGHAVRGFARSASRWTERPAGGEIAVGDVTDAGAVRRAVDACDAVIHAAALVKLWVRDPRRFDEVNVGGLGHVIAAVRGTGKKLLHISSFIALGPTDGTTLDEDSPRRGLDFHNDYERTKWLADRLAREQSPAEVRIVRLYPGVVYGPGALTAGNHVVGLLLDHARGKLPGLLGTGQERQCFAYVDDVVEGVLRALERAEPASGYVLGGDNRTAVELFDAFERASGIAPPRRRIPFGVAAAVGRIQRWRAECFGIEPKLTDGVVGIYRHEWAYSSDRAVRDLGYRITPLEEGVRATVHWLRSIGKLA